MRQVTLKLSCQKLFSCKIWQVFDIAKIGKFYKSRIRHFSFKKERQGLLKSVSASSILTNDGL